MEGLTLRRKRRAMWYEQRDARREESDCFGTDNAKNRMNKIPLTP